MSQDIFPDQIILPPSFQNKAIKDSSGRCWGLQQLSDPTGTTISNLSEFEISDDYPCCEMCLTNLFEDITLENEVDAIDFTSIRETLDGDIRITIDGRIRILIS